MPPQNGLPTTVPDKGAWVTFAGVLHPAAYSEAVPQLWCGSETSGVVTPIELSPRIELSSRIVATPN
jgi:hypothetical protein